MGLDNSDGSLERFASGVAIDKRWVVTAGHVVENEDFSFRFGAGPNVMTQPGDSWENPQVFIYPGYEGGWGLHLRSWTMFQRPWAVRSHMGS